jgi:opacity protein-like surface antigen
MKLNLVLVSLSLLSTPVLAQQKKIKRYRKSRSVRRIKKSTKKATSLEKSYDLSVGVTKRDLKDNDNDGVDGYGVSANAGKIFNLGSGISTTTSLTTSILTLDLKHIDSSDDFDATTYEVGLSQKLSYNIESSSLSIRPFIEAGYSIGKYQAKSSVNETGFSGNAELDINYSKYGGAAGVQLALSNGLTPFIKYNISKFIFSNKGELSSNINGTSSSESVSFGSTSERTLDSNTLTVGLGYMF